MKKAGVKRLLKSIEVEFIGNKQNRGKYIFPGFIIGTTEMSPWVDWLLQRLIVSKALIMISTLSPY